MFKKRKKLKISILILMLGIVVIAFFANSFVKKHGYANLWDFITTYSSNKSKASNAKFETLEIKIDQNDFEKLEDERNKALERGILIKEGNTYVDAKLKHNGKKIKAEIRLKGHMTDHLQDKKWSFRIKTKGGDAFMGMKVFSIQHPGTRNYIYEWIYHEMMKQENIIALNYDFIKVKVDGEDWGIYAVEEHFAQELVGRNNKPKGPLLRFNPDMYWQARIAESEKLSYQMDYASFESSFLEVYDDKNTYKDSVLLNGYQRAANLMELFRNGNLSTSQVFDVKKLAVFHAIIDLIGGHRSLDWSDVKYYYNYETNKIEPVAYESFSIQPTFSICGSNRFTSNSQSGIETFHDILFSDPVFYSEYIKQVQRIASSKWLKTFLKRIDKQLQNKLATVYTDYAYKNYTPEPYFKNIKLINKILHPLKGIHAYIRKIENDSIELSVAGIDALPFEIWSLKIDTTNIRLKQPIIVSSKLINETLNYQYVKFILPNHLADKITSSTNFELYYNVLGLNSNKKLSIDVVSVNMDEFLDSKDLCKPIIEKETDLAKLNFINLKHRSILEFRTGKIVIDKNIIIPHGYQIFINEATSIDFINSARIISYSPIFIHGTDENPVTLFSSDQTGGGIVLLNTQSPSFINYMVAHNIGNSKSVFENSAVICVYESILKMSNCSFYENNWNDIRVVRGALEIGPTTFSKTIEDALVSYYSKVQINNCKFLKIGDDAIESTGSIVKMKGIEFVDIKSSAILAKCKSEVTISNSGIKKAKTGISVSDNSHVICNQMIVEGCDLAFKAFQKGDVFGPAQLSVKGLKQSGNKQLQEVEKGSSIKIIK